MPHPTATIRPKDPADRKRWDITRLRRRILENVWKGDVSQRLSRRLTPGRQVNIGEPVTSLNLFESTVQQLAIQYDKPPTVRNPAFENEETAELWEDIQRTTHIWQLAQANAEFTIGLRENLVKILRTDDGVRLTLVPPDTVTVETADGDPGKILVIREASIYTIQGKQVVAWTIWDISDPAAPVRTIRTQDDQDISNIADPDWEGWVDFDEDGAPFLPFVRYRARWTPTVWDARAWTTLVEASLDTAVLWTCWNKWVLDASWAQRYVIDLILQGLTVTGDGTGATASVEADPSSILCFKSIGDKPGSAGTFTPPGNPKELADSIMSFQGSALATIGIHPADIAKTNQPQSGVSIQLKRSSQRRMAKQFISQFRDGDTELLTKIALTHNDLTEDNGLMLPVTDWVLVYHLPEQSREEIEAELGQDLTLIKAGLASPVDVFIKMFPGITRAEALTRLLEIRTENALLAVANTSHIDDNNTSHTEEV